MSCYFYSKVSNSYFISKEYQKLRRELFLWETVQMSRPFSCTRRFRNCKTNTIRKEIVVYTLSLVLRMTFLHFFFCTLVNHRICYTFQRRTFYFSGKEQCNLNNFVVPSFAEHANQIRIVGPSSSVSASPVSADTSIDRSSASSSSSTRLSDQPVQDWTTDDVATLMSSALEPHLEAKLKQKRHVDRMRIQQIIRATEQSQKIYRKAHIKNYLSSYLSINLDP